MKTQLSFLAALALGFAACDVKVNNPPGDTTIVNPPSEKKVESNTTIVNPPAKETTEKSTTTTVTGGAGSVTSEKTTETK